jgi:hypothetical protein
MVLCGGSLLISALATAVQLYHVDRTFQAHLAAGGVDDPDVVFGHFNPLMFLLPIAVLISFLGWASSSLGWIFIKVRRHARKPLPIHR